MNESVSETIKDPSEAFLAIGTAICLIVKTKREKTSKRSKQKKNNEEKIAGDGFEPPASGWLWARRASWLLYPAELKFPRWHDGHPRYIE